VAGGGEVKSGDEVFMARRSDGTVAALKLRCLPKRADHVGKGIKTPGTCDGLETGDLDIWRSAEEPISAPRHEQLNELANIRLGALCGLSDLLVPAWVERTSGLLPYPLATGKGKGELEDLRDSEGRLWLRRPSEDGEGDVGHARFNQSALWTEIAPGSSISSVAMSSRLQAGAGEAMIARVRPEAIRAAAVFDLLAGHYDRHVDNVYVGEDGGLKLIDNENSFARTRKGNPMSLNSVFIPGTEYFRAFLSRPALVGLDVRCHGPIGTSFPEGVSRCLVQLSDAPVKAVRLGLGVYQLRQAQDLKRRAKLLMTAGFEGALETLMDSPRREYFREEDIATRQGKPLHWRLAFVSTTYRPAPEPQCPAPKLQARGEGRG